jgi:hypothetical protein
VPIPDDDTRRRVFRHIVDDMNQAHCEPRPHAPLTHLADWMAGSPLVEIIFDD